MQKIQKTLNFLLPILSVLSIVAVWAVAAAKVDSEYILPSPIESLSAMFALFGEREFYNALFNTLLRAFEAFAISFILSFVLAVLSDKSEIAVKIISPIIAIIRALPTIAVVLLLLFWTTSYIAPIIVTMLVVLPTVYTEITNALSSVDKKQIEMCKVFNVSEKDVIMKVKAPQILPSVYKTVGSGFSLNLKLMVAAEVISQTAYSIGYMLNTSKIYFEVSTMIALVIVTVAIGLIIEGVFSFLSKKAGKWK